MRFTTPRARDATLSLTKNLSRKSKKSIKRASNCFSIIDVRESKLSSGESSRGSGLVDARWNVAVRLALKGFEGDFHVE
jgi:hypothetical protein